MMLLCTQFRLNSNDNLVMKHNTVAVSCIMESIAIWQAIQWIRRGRSCVTVISWSQIKGWTNSTLTSLNILRPHTRASYHHYKPFQYNALRTLLAVKQALTTITMLSHMILHHRLMTHDQPPLTVNDDPAWDHNLFYSFAVY